MDEETLYLILEAQNQASPVIRQLKRELLELDAVAQKVRDNVAKSGDTIEAGEAIKAARLIINTHRKRTREEIALATDAAKREVQVRMKENERLQRFLKAGEDLRHQSALQAIRAEERQRTAAIQREKLQRDLAHMSAMQAIKAEARAAAEAAKHRAEMSRLRDSGMAGGGRIISGGMQAIGGLGQMASITMRWVGILGQGLGILGQIGSTIQNVVTSAFHEAEKAALMLTGTVTALMGITAKMGTQFNMFQENTLMTLEAMTDSAQMAKRIFDFSFKLAIPAKFTFEEVLEGARTLQAFGMNLDTYGQAQGRYLRNAVALAQGMEKPLSQVTRFLGNLSQGRLLLQQAAPLAMGRQTLQKYGVQFDTHGSPTDRTKLLEAAMRAIEDKWGNLLDKMGNTYESKLDSMVSMTRMFSGKITEGFFGSLTKAFGNIGDFFRDMINPQTDEAKRLVEGLKTPFDLLGKAIEAASEQLPAFANWLSTILTKDNIINFLAEVITLFQTIGNDIKSFAQSQGMDGNSLVGIWNAFKKAAGDAIGFVIDNFNGFLAGVDYLIERAPMVWQAIIDGANQFKGILEVIAGLMTTMFGAQMTGAISNVVMGFVNMAVGLKQSKDLLTAIKGMSGAKDAATATAAGGGFRGAMAAGGGFLKTAGATVSRFAGPVAIAAGGIGLAHAANNAMDARQGKQGVSLWDTVRHIPAAFGIGAQNELAADPNTARMISEMRARSQARMAMQGGSPALAMPGAPNFGGVPGQLQNVGRWSINQAGNAAMGLVPDSVKALGGGFMDAWQRGVAASRARREANQPKLLEQNKKWLRGLLTKDTVKAAVAKRDDMPPAHGTGAQGQGGPIIRDPALVKQIIEAYEASISSLDTDEKRVRRGGFQGLYQELLSGQMGAVKSAREEMAQTRNSMGQEKTEDEIKNDQIKYWGALETVIRTQQEIAEIRKEAGEAVRQRAEEAADAQIEMVRAQLELVSDSDRAAKEVERLIPMLQMKQKTVADKLRAAMPGTKKAFELQQQGYKIEAEIAATRERAAEEARKRAFETPQRQFGTLKKLIDMLPERAQGMATQRLLFPRIMQAFKAAQGETDPVQKQNKFLEVADMFSTFKEGQKASKDPFDNLFERGLSGQRSLALQQYRARVMGFKGSRRIGAARGANALMSPFAPMPMDAGSGLGVQGDQLTQIILNLPANASEQQIADAIMRVLQKQLEKSGRR